MGTQRHHDEMPPGAASSCGLELRVTARLEQGRLSWMLHILPATLCPSGSRCPALAPLSAGFTVLEPPSGFTLPRLRG